MGQTNSVPQSPQDRIQSRSPAELQAIAARYNLKISGSAGNTFGRIGFWLLCLVAVFTFCALAVGALMPHSSSTMRLVMTVGFWVVVSGLLTHLVLIEVGQISATKSLNLLTGSVHIFLSGWAILYPWEKVIPGFDSVSLRSGTTRPGMTFPSKDGIGVTFRDSMVRWRVYPPALLINASHDDATITKGASDILTSILGQEISRSTVAELRTAEKQREIEQRLLSALYSRSNADTFGYTFEEQFGVCAEISALGSIEFSKDYQEAVTGVVTMDIYRATATALVEASKVDGRPTLSYREAMNLVMINAKEGVSKHITELHISMDENASIAASSIAEILRSGGPEAVRLFNAVRGGRDGGSNPQI